MLGLKHVAHETYHTQYLAGAIISYEVKHAGAVPYWLMQAPCSAVRDYSLSNILT